MNNEKKAPVLTLEHIVPYLPYELELFHEGNKRTHLLDVDIKRGIYERKMSVVSMQLMVVGVSKLKPILRPLSEYKDINSKSMNNLDTDLQIQVEIWDLANKKIAFQSLSYGTAMECFANHIDIFGLIEKGLAIDINSIEGKETKGNV